MMNMKTYYYGMFGYLFFIIELIHINSVADISNRMNNADCSR